MFLITFLFYILKLSHLLPCEGLSEGSKYSGPDRTMVLFRFFNILLISGFGEHSNLTTFLRVVLIISKFRSFYIFPIMLYWVLNRTLMFRPNYKFLVILSSIIVCLFLSVVS